MYFVNVNKYKEINTNDKRKKEKQNKIKHHPLPIKRMKKHVKKKPISDTPCPRRPPV